MNETRRIRRVAVAKTARDLAEQRPRVVVAPDLLEYEHAVIREDDDSEADYEARSRLLAAALKHEKDTHDER